jgi:sulfopyruvate decarboxylase subunit beta
LNRRDAVEAFAEVRQGAPAITGPGATSGTLYVTRHEAATIYNMEMGYATAMALGVALAAPDQWVVALEGDGSLIAGMPVFATISRYLPRNLTVLALDNHVYGTGSGQEPTATAHRGDIAAIARACGIEQVVSVAEAAELREQLTAARSTPGPWVIVADIDQSDARPAPGRPRPGVDVTESGVYFFRAMLERRSG